ncbi:hypothetical protein [Candidatus Nitrotoga arctica]|uniref:HEPN_RiboL-PSP domain-containing protein n=1 Tax=Candidatus Nitrotoga arctica TaxID=453162 RepID=A0ABM8YZL1_9PROT|nr:hypothetical protein [Candidatus Nitrotoga arctica]CAG9932948.1 HEPN_RiboL-PSP domain-containing protein [Candidatus Nitrotoga arctica]
MDYLNILRARENRQTRKDRIAKPFDNFFETFDQCMDAGTKFLEGGIQPEYASLIERSIIISTVSAIEVYYRDMLDFIFKFCSPEFFEPKLKLLHTQKYDILELQDIYAHNIHPLELVSKGQSFQNAEQIEKVFSLFLDKKNLWNSLKERQIRRKDKPETIYKWSDDDLQGLKDTFALRHELVHDPAHITFLTKGILSNLGAAGYMVWGSDKMLISMMVENKDPNLKNGN